ncbi:MAG: type II secretion system F family protein [Salinibacterium sp.]|nr:type II secretion system F family protein [Salinibacterium sp.]MBF0672753.1 type II secretion system F family protein [Salinibacterium sp.]
MLMLGMAVLVLGVLALGWLLLVPDAHAHARGNLSRGAAEAAGGAATKTATQGASRGGVRRVMPAASVDRVIRLIDAAGRPAEQVERMLQRKIVLAAVGLVLGVLIGVGTASPIGWLLAIALVVLGWFGPEIYLNGRAGDRRKAIDSALADTLDQLTIAVEAGLGFEAALARIVHNGRGPLAEELGRTLQAMQLGVTRRDAYRALADRVQLPDLDRFVRAVIQADAYGVPISTVLRIQSNEVRMRRRQRLEEQAMKIPVKITFPLMLCLMPVLFIMVLGPVIINAVEAFQ